MLFYDFFDKSPVQEITFCNRKIYLKRDDLLHPDFSGNKARKFYGFFNKDLSKYKRVASYGGHQSNAMLSLAAFAKIHGLKFDYYAKPLPDFLKKSQIGNFRHALRLGMNLIETADYDKITRGEIELTDPRTLFIKQGGAVPKAEAGVKLLAGEIEGFAQEKEVSNLAVVLPSGTGATALYLQKHLPYQVYTVPNVGNKAYLRKQFSELETDTKNYPEIWDFDTKKYIFGKLYPEFYDIWKKLLIQTGIEFELLYDPKTWLILCEKLDNLSAPVLYIHCGGITGNESMLARYKRSRH